MEERKKVEFSKNEFWRFTENNKANSTRGKKGEILENIFRLFFNKKKSN